MNLEGRTGVLDDEELREAESLIGTRYGNAGLDLSKDPTPCPLNRSR